MISAGMLPQSATIARPTETIRTSGMVTVAFTTIASSVPCSVQPANDRLRQRMEGRTKEPVFRFWADLPLDLVANDRVTIGGTAYEALEVDDVAGRSAIVKAVLTLDRRVAT